MHTFTRIYLHVVFATWSRRRSIIETLREPLHRYISGAARNLGLSDVEVGGWDDHVHLLGRFDAAVSASNAIGRIKQSATRWMHEAGSPAFRWQRGFSAFSVSFARLPAAVRYIRAQEQHHRSSTFAEELERLLADCGVSIEDVHLL